MKAKQSGAVLALVVICVAVAAALHADLRREGGRGPFADPIDFIAFRCAGRVAASGADPYRAEPLRSCERAAYAESHLTMVRNLVVPAPLPPYALVAFEPLGLLPFRVALEVWFGVLVAAFALTCVMLARISRAPLWLVTACLLPADLLASAVVGQLVPLVLLAMCGSAAALQAKRYRPAALLALPALLEPHLGLALCAGLAWCEKRTRLPLACGLLVVGAMSLWAGGLARNAEYVRLVLPAHAAAEVFAFNAQYGLSALLAALGVPAETALVAGSASYVVMLMAGVRLGQRLAATTGVPSFAALTPVAAVLIGGPFLHVHQMAAALPLALLLGGPRPWRSPALLLALFCLSIPWESVAELAPRSSPAASATRHVAVDRVLLGYGDGARLAEDAWGAWVRAHPYDARTAADVVRAKFPTWLGLTLLACAALRCCRRTASAGALTGRPSPELRTLRG